MKVLSKWDEFGGQWSVRISFWSFLKLNRDTNKKQRTKTSLQRGNSKLHMSKDLNPLSSHETRKETSDTKHLELVFSLWRLVLLRSGHGGDGGGLGSCLFVPKGPAIFSTFSQTILRASPDLLRRRTGSRSQKAFWESEWERHCWGGTELLDLEYLVNTNINKFMHPSGNLEFTKLCFSSIHPNYFLFIL